MEGNFVFFSCAHETEFYRSWMGYYFLSFIVFFGAQGSG